MLKSLAFDFGASSGKAILSEFDGEKISLREIHRFSNDPVMFNGTLYWDILRLMNEMKHTLIRCYQEGHQDLASASSDTWGVDFGLLDKNGQLIANPVHYRDKRTDGMQEEAAKYVSDEEFYNSTGVQFMKLNTVYQLLALSKIQKELLDLADTLLFMPDLFNYYLSGEMLCEYSIASTSQLLNARTKEWDKAILKKLNIRDDLLKDPVPSGTPAGKLTKDMCQATGLRDVKIIATAGHDTASAVLAVPSSKKDFAYISSGTWSLLGTECPEPVINEHTFRLNYTNEGGFGGRIRLLKNIMGLWILQESKRQWELETGPIQYDRLDKWAEEAEAFLAFIDPDDGVFYEPGDMPSRIREYCKNTGQKIPETRGQITRCILESLAMKYRYAITALEKIRGVTFEELHVVGGGSKNDLLLRFTASAIGKPVIAGPVEATSAGNIAGQLICLGELKDIPQARELIRRSFEPKIMEPIDTQAWDDAYDTFLKVTGLDKEA